MFILRGAGKKVQSLKFTPDATTLYAVMYFTGVEVWNLPDRAASSLDVGSKGTSGTTRVENVCAIHPGGRWAFVSMDHPAGLIDLQTRLTKPFHFNGLDDRIAIAPDGRTVVTIEHSDVVTPRRGRSHSMRLYAWKMTATGPKYAWHRNMPENSDQWLVVYAGNDAIVTGDRVVDSRRLTIQQPRLCVRSATNGKPSQVLNVPTDCFNQLLASPDGKYVVTRRGTALWVWDANDWEKPPTVVAGNPAKGLWERAAAFHPSGRYLLHVNNGPSVIVYDTMTWKQVRKWKWDAGTLRAVAVSPDGALAAAAGPRGNVVVWDLDL